MSLRRSAKRLGAVVAALLVAAGTTIVFDASSFVSGSAPPTETLRCNDTWLASGTAGDWDTAANWSSGVPNGTGIDACISGNANVVLADASFSVGQLTVSAGSSLTIGTDPASTTTATSTSATSTTDTTAPTALASLTVSSGLQNAGSLTVLPSGASNDAGLAVDGPILNSGTLTVGGAVDLAALAPPSTSAALAPPP